MLTFGNETFVFCAYEIRVATSHAITEQDFILTGENNSGQYRQKVTARNTRTNPPNKTSMHGEVNTNCWKELSDTEHRQRESNNCITRLVRYIFGFQAAGRLGWRGGRRNTSPRLGYIPLARRPEH